MYTKIKLQTVGPSMLKLSMDDIDIFISSHNHTRVTLNHKTDNNIATSVG